MKTPKTLVLLACLIVIFSCTRNQDNKHLVEDPAIIPLPQKLVQKDGSFEINRKTKLIINVPAEGIDFVLANLNSDLDKFGLEKNHELGSIVDNSFFFKQDSTIFNKEAYKLEINPKHIQISYGSTPGAFYAVQTLRQLFPIHQNNEHSSSILEIKLPCCLIEDAPRFTYRGMHLDVGRHFFDVDFIKKYIDQLAFHKFNRFHWHLTEDQGWRIEIKRYPKLAEISAFRKETIIGHLNSESPVYDGKRYGGFYTQDQIREIVDYALERNITIIPEIELPGHSQAVLAAYPELACTDGPFEVATSWGVKEEVFCPKENTFEFLENVLSEVIDLFPSEYIHIGGDECPKKRWEQCSSCQKLIKREGLKDEHELQSYFITRIEKFLNSKGKQIIGWDEILEGGLAPNATVMSWRGIQGGIEAAQQGHDVIMTPTSHCYFDYYQSRNPEEPLAIGGFLPLEKVYSYEPIPSVLTEKESTHILGVQGNVWTEYIRSPEYVEYMTFPRACALAEVAWSSKEIRDFDDFSHRLVSHLSRLNEMGINTARHLYDVKTKVNSGEGNGVQVMLFTQAPELPIYYTLDGSIPDQESNLFTEPIEIGESGSLICYAYNKNQSIENKRTVQHNFHIHKAAGRKIELISEPSSKYFEGGKGALINGITGSDQHYNEREWVGFSGKDFEAIIDFGENTTFSQVSIGFFDSPQQWIHLPKKVEIYGSTDGIDFLKIEEVQNFESKGKIAAVDLKFEEVQAKFLKIKALRHGIIAEGNNGAGNEAWLFIEEIIVE